MAHLDKSRQMDEEIFHLARVALEGRRQDVAVLVRKYARRYRSTAPELAERLMALLRNNTPRVSPTRRIEQCALPVDGDSRLPLVRMIETPMLETEPVYDTRTWGALRQITREREQSERLAQEGVEPTRSVLFTGPPGVGKTLAAKWMAREVEQPLAILDLSAVMSSFLGRTGSNVRAVLDFARAHNCILLLDELDAVAKRRDDTSEIGELKRLVHRPATGDRRMASELLASGRDEPCETPRSGCVAAFRGCGRVSVAGTGGRRGGASRSP